MTNNTNLSNLAIEAIQDADFRAFWPVEVRKALVRAAQHEGELPPFAVREVRWALRAADEVERRMNRDIVAGEAVLSQTERRRLALSR